MGKQKLERIELRVSVWQKRRIERRAERAGVTVSEYIRKLALLSDCVDDGERIGMTVPQPQARG